MEEVYGNLDEVRRYQEEQQISWSGDIDDPHLSKKDDLSLIVEEQNEPR